MKRDAKRRPSPAVLHPRTMAARKVDITKQTRTIAPWPDHCALRTPERSTTSSAVVISAKRFFAASTISSSYAKPCKQPAKRPNGRSTPCASWGITFLRYLGSEKFHAELMAAAARAKTGSSHSAWQRGDIARATSERIVKEELNRLNWKDGDLEKRIKGDDGEFQLHRKPD